MSAIDDDMKNFLPLFFLIITFLFIGEKGQSQNTDLRWGLGLHAKLIEPKTSLGDDFFTFNLSRITIGQGISLSRYLNKSFDLGIFFSQGRMSQSSGIFNYKDRYYAGDLRLKYKLFNGYIFKENALIGMYLSGGIGGIYAEVDAFGSSEGNLNDEIYQQDIYAGAGFRIKLSDYVYLDLNSGIHLPSDNTWDANTGGDKDQFLEHSLGIVINLGKKLDADGDKVNDRKDKCPNTPIEANVDANGCPIDSDNDGIADYLDECPLLPGILPHRGCPDTDGDGIADQKDLCPEIAGLAALHGCPDSDGDGIKDLLDKCPNTKAGYVVDSLGCPLDNDSDTVINEEDDCPDEKGSPVLKGCPDRDNDGIADKIDKCPDVAGILENNGCPELPKEIIKEITKIASKIFFASASDQLISASMKELDDLVVILIKYPETNLLVEGHTDNSGDPEKNVTLSTQRCETVMKYLVSKGIDAARITAVGYGDTKPLDNNKTAAGRAKNRRVEIITQY